MGGRRLYDIAHARAGDKGNRLNIAVFPFDDGDFAALSDFLTEARPPCGAMSYPSCRP